MPTSAKRKQCWKWESCDTKYHDRIQRSREYMRVTLLLLWVTIAYAQKNATDTTRKKAAANNDVVVSIVKISRDSPRPLVAYNQGSLAPPFPAIAKIRSKTKPTSSDQIISDVGSEAISGLNEDLHKLVNSLEHAKSSKGVFLLAGAFFRKATRTGSSYSTNPFQVEYTGEPYLSGYRGIPEGQEASSGGPNYMGALTKSNKAGKHTFGSYGSIDSEKAQMWQSRSMGSNVAGYDRSGSYANNVDYNGGYSMPSTVYISPESTYSTRSNPYSASYQEGSDNNNYGNGNRYGSSDYSNYGSQMSGGINTQSNSQGYDYQRYSSLPTQGYDNTVWLPYGTTRQSSWPQQSYQNVDDGYSQNSGYGNMEVEKMPDSGYMDYQYPSSSYSTPTVSPGYTGDLYNSGNGASYGQVNQQNYNYGSYMSSGTTNSGSSSQFPSFIETTYGMPSTGGSTYDNGNDYVQQGNYGNDYVQQGNYGNSNAWNQYSTSDTGSYQSTYQPSWNYGSPNVQSSGGNGDYDYYKPTQGYGTGQSYGNAGYQSDTYNPGQTMGDYGNSYSGNYGGGYQNNAQQGQYMNYGGGPQVEFTMNVGYGSSRTSGVTTKPSLTNNIVSSGLDEDGYRTVAK
ncbi:unnamed protein product [Haemonchus placei]|uniref:Secreted protein n=1 Tax=Haemonchus placei TaxID=6290 RepID=A0A0N4X178_HAEPC|nr:unnamed protein product [Haemonchus placei]